MTLNDFVADTTLHLGPFYIVLIFFTILFLVIGYLLDFYKNTPFLNKYSLVPGVVVFTLGFLFLSGTFCYAVFEPAPAIWFSTMPHAEGRYFKVQMRHFKTAMSINQFVQLEQAYHQTNHPLAYLSQMQAIR